LGVFSEEAGFYLRDVEGLKTVSENLEVKKILFGFLWR
jgi:hypothetical protein